MSEDRFEDRRERVGPESTVERHSVVESTELHKAMPEAEKQFDDGLMEVDAD